MRIGGACQCMEWSSNYEFIFYFKRGISTHMSMNVSDNRNHFDGCFPLDAGVLTRLFRYFFY